MPSDAALPDLRAGGMRLTTMDLALLASSIEANMEPNQDELTEPIKQLLDLYIDSSENQEIRNLLLSMELIAARVQNKARAIAVAPTAAITGPNQDNDAW